MMLVMNACIQVAKNCAAIVAAIIPAIVLVQVFVCVCNRSIPAVPSPNASKSIDAIAMFFWYNSTVIVHPSKYSTEASPACFRFSFLSIAITSWCMIGSL